jgi:hypothetical protein
MRQASLRHAGTQRPPEDDIFESSAVRPIIRDRGSSAFTGSGFRTLRRKDKVLETSIQATAKLSDNIPQRDKSRSVQDIPTGRVASEDEILLDDRARLILALLVRKESLELIDRVLCTDDVRCCSRRTTLCTLSLVSFVKAHWR